MAIGLFVSILVIIISLYSALAIKHPLLRSIIIFFVGLYGFQLILAIWDPYLVYPVSPITIIAFNLQIIFLVSGAKYSARKRVNHSSSILSFTWPTIKMSFPLLFVITCLLYYSFQNYMKMQVVLASFGEQTSLAREYYYKEFFSSYTLNVLHNILMSFQYIAYFISFTKIFSSKEKLRIPDLYFIIATICILILTTLTTTGRGDFLSLVFILVFFALISRIYDSNGFKKRAIPVFGIILGLFVAVLVTTTLLRTNNTSVDGRNINELFVEPFATYFYVPILAFDYSKDTILNYGYPFFGGAVFAGFWDFLITPLAFFDHSFMSLSMNSILGSRMTPGMSFPSGLSWNALFTGCSNYYIDFWYFGFIIYPFLHGLVLGKLVYGMKRKLSYFIFLSFFFFCSYKHVVSLGIQSMQVVFVIIWIYIALHFRIIKVE